LTDAQKFVQQLRAVCGKDRDVTQFPFKVMFEVRATQNAMARTLAGTGWDVATLSGNNHNNGGDCSHLNDGGGSSFVRLCGPQTTLAAGGLENLADVLDRLQRQKVELGTTSAMRILVPDSLLDDKGMSNLVGMHSSNDDILYRLGQAGGSGRNLAHKQSYSVPMSSSYTTANSLSVAEWKQQLNQRHRSINSFTAGMWEFRYFDSSLDIKAVQGNVCLLLGMIAAAADGRGGFTELHTTADYPKEVSRDRWNALMNAAVGPGPLRWQLEMQFRASGGQLQTALDGPALDAANHMTSRGFRFEKDGRVFKAAELNEAVMHGTLPQIVTPGGKRYDVDFAGLQQFLIGEGGLQAPLAAPVQSAREQFERLGSASFRDPSGVELGTFQAAFEYAQNHDVMARLGDVDIKLSAKPDAGGLPLEQAAAVPSEDWRQLGTLGLRLDGPLDSPAAAAYWLQLRRGCTFKDDAGQARLGAVLASSAQDVRITFNSGLEVKLGPADVQRAGQWDRDPKSAAAADAAGRDLMGAAAELVGFGATVAVGNASATAQPTELFAATLAHAPVRITDPLGQTRTVHGIDEFLQNMTILRAIGANNTTDQSAVMAGFDDGVGKRFVATTLAPRGAVPLTNGRMLPWVLNNNGQLRLTEVSVTPGVEQGVKVDNWARLRDVMAVESGAPPPPQQAQIIDLAERLRSKGVAFYYVHSKHQPTDIGLKSALVERVQSEGVRARLPGFKFWRGWFHKKIVIRNEADLKKLARKYGVA
jgi:hypothetical protein